MATMMQLEASSPSRTPAWPGIMRAGRETPAPPWAKGEGQARMETVLGVHHERTRA
jgi:hypothetical protein